MTKIRITKEFTFETSHMLKDYDGLCRNIHGHSYKLLVTLSGQPLKDTASPKKGMVIDFGDLKDIITKEIIDKFDHSLLVNEDIPAEQKEKITTVTERVIFLKYQPTCENMVSDFVVKIIDKLPEGVSLQRLRLYETHTSYAEWVADDNY